MVGKWDNKTEEVNSGYLLYLKLNNRKLAKSLTDEKLVSKQYLDERNQLLEQLQTARLLNKKYEAILKNMQDQSKQVLLPNVVALTESITQMIQLSCQGVCLSKTYTDQPDARTRLSVNMMTRPSSPGVSNKTHAVKPMVGGHVIHLPTVNLFRIRPQNNEDVHEEPESPETTDVLQNGTSETQALNYPIRGLNLEFEDYPEDVNYASTEEENGLNMIPVVSLENISQELHTVKEEDEDENDASNNMEESIKEARVMLSPLILSPDKSEENNLQVNTSRHSSSSTSDRNYDPLEGPSTLLDENRCHRKQRSSNTYSHKRKPQSPEHDESDSSEEFNPYLPNNTQRKKRNKKFTKKPVVVLKQLTEKRQKDQQEPKVADNKTESNLENINPEHVSPRDRNSIDRPRRSKVTGSLKEMSLRCKLRRT